MASRVRPLHAEDILLAVGTLALVAGALWVPPVAASLLTVAAGMLAWFGWSALSLRRNRRTRREVDAVLRAFPDDQSAASGG
jgi:membrane protein implicated in regulation of membrane protease activity